MRATEGERTGSAQGNARGRILAAAYHLFSRYGVRAVGIEEIIARSGVAKATLYRHFPSKDHLVLAFLADRERRWTVGWVKEQASRRGSGPRERLLAIFDLFDDWFRDRENFDACSFVSVLLEMGSHHPAGHASIGHLANIRGFVRELADEAGLRETEAFAHSWHILMKGSIIAAVEGDTDAARRAQAMARRLIESHSEPAANTVYR